VLEIQWNSLELIFLFLRFQPFFDDMKCVLNRIQPMCFAVKASIVIRKQTGDHLFLPCVCCIFQ